MYKVFFNDRIVFINSSANVDKHNGACYVNVTTELNMSEVWNDFINDTEKRNLFLLSDSADDAMKKFSSIFKIIEAAGGLVFNVQGELLCIYRLEKWDLPKGKIEKGERREIAAVREVEEETGINNPVIEEQLETTYHIYQSPWHNNAWVLKPTYWFRMNYSGNDELIPQTKEDISVAKWVAKDEIPELTKDTYPSLVGLFQVL